MDIDQIKALAEIMVEHDLSRIEWQEGESQVLLRRGQPVSLSYSPAPMQQAASQAPAAQSAAPASSGSSGGAAAATPSASKGNETYIRSPMVGTFYASPDPESPAFVSVGDSVSPDTVVCLVEAMKVFNEIKAEVSGRITQVLVSNAQAVEFDQPLFAIAPS